MSLRIIQGWGLSGMEYCKKITWRALDLGGCGRRPLLFGKLCEPRDVLEMAQEKGLNCQSAQTVWLTCSMQVEVPYLIGGISLRLSIGPPMMVIHGSRSGP